MNPYRTAADACRAAWQQAIADRVPYAYRDSIRGTALLCDRLARESGEEEAS